MVRGVPVFRLLVPLVHGEVGDPEEFVIGGGACFFEEPVLVGKLLAELQPERADAFVDPLRIVVPALGCAELRRDDNREVVRGETLARKDDLFCIQLRADRLGERLEGLARAQPCYVEKIEAGVAEALAHLVGQRAPLRAGERAGAGDGEAEHGEGLLDPELFAQRRRELGREVDHGGQTHVRLVDAVAADRLVVGHLEEGRRECNAGGSKCGFQEALGHAEDALLRGKAHLEIDLGELRLAIGAQVFITEAAGDLEVAVKARDHEDLLEDLRRLRQCVEAAGVHAAGHEVVARSLGRRARHERRLDLEEALADEVVANRHGDAAAQREVGLHLFAAQVEVAILEAHLFVGDRVLGWREWRRLRVVQQQQLGGDDFNPAGRHVRVFKTCTAAADRAACGDDELRPRGLAFGVRGGGGLPVEHHLRDAAAIA